MKTLIPSAFLTLLVVPASQAATFCFDDTNTGQINNGVAGGAGTTISTTSGVTTVTNTDGSNNTSGFASTDDIATLLGRTLTSSDTVSVSLTVDSITGDLVANGFEFGLSPDNSSFRPINNLIFQLRADNGVAQHGNGSIVNPGVSTVGATEASLLDGFTVNLFADANGYTFSASDILLTDGSPGTSLSLSGSFANPADFTSFFDNAHFYATAQTGNEDFVTTISAAKIDIPDLAAVPEPSRALLLLGASAVMMLRRRR